REMRELGARIDVGNRARKHSHLADPVERAGLDRSKSHYQVDDEERDLRHEAHRKQIERAILCDAVIDRLQLVAELALDPVAKEISGSEKGERRSDRGR